MRRRRILIFFAALLAAGVILVLTVPWWLGLALRATPDKWGVRFARYERIGYSRFALHEVEYRVGSVRITVGRIEADSPMVWLAHRWNGRPREIAAEKWAVIVEPTPTVAAPPAAPVSTAPTVNAPAPVAPPAPAVPASTTPPASPSSTHGWMWLHGLLLRIADQLEHWLPKAKLGEGRVSWPGGGLTLGSATWEKRTLDVKAFAMGGMHADVTAEFPAGVDELRVKAKTLDDAGTAAIANRGSEVSGEITWWQQQARLSGKFGPSGWLPAQAVAEADDWSIPGVKLKLGTAYEKVRGRARVSWSEEHFRANVAVNGEPIAKKKVPPLEVTLGAYGDLKAVSIETLHVALPGIVADLNAPVMVDRQGKFAPSSAVFSVKADLAKQPWFEAKGLIEGEAKLIPGAAQKPVVDFRLVARDVAAATFAMTSLEASGGFAWPEITVAKASIVGTAGERFEARGGWDFESKELIAVAIDGEIRRATLARWLPAQLQFDAVAIKAEAHGSLANAEHSGEIHARNVIYGSVKPLALAATWTGHGEKVEKLELGASAGDTKVTLAGALDVAGVQLNAAELTQKNESRLRLTQPAVIRWSPGLQIEGLRFAGAESSIQADLAWAETGSAAVVVQKIPTAWFSDLVTLPGLGGEISSIAITGEWDRGPMKFSAVVGAAFDLGEGRRAVVNLSGHGDKGGVQLEALRAAEGEASIVNATGVIPVVFTPGQPKLVQIDERAELKIDADTAPNAAFWTELAGITGLELKEPHAAVHLKGTWRRPEGDVQLKVTRIAADPKRFKRPMPTIEGLDVAVVGDPAGLRLDRLALRIEGQEVKGSGRLPIGEADWPRVWKEPLVFVQRGADARLEIPDADLAAFARFLPTSLAPKGRLHLDLNYKASSFDGSLRLSGAATRPLGPLGVLQDVEADLKLEGRTLELRSVTAKSGGENVKLTGKLELPVPKAGEPLPLPKFDVALQGNNLPFVRSSGLLMRGDLDLKLTTPDQGSPLLSGKVKLRDSLFLQDLRALRPGGAHSVARRPPYFSIETPPLNTWRLEIAVEGEKFMRLRTTLFNGVASVKLNLSGTLQEPVAIGEATVDEGKVRLPFAGFDVLDGRVMLTREQPYEPQLAVSGVTRRFGYDLRLELTGTASAPVLTFTSSPSLENGQILLMVMTGQSPSTDQTLTDQQRAQGVGAFIGQSLLASLGDSEQVDRFSFETGDKLSDQGRETYEVEYKLDDRWSVVGEYDEFDDINAGLKWRAYTKGGREDTRKKKKNENTQQ